MRPTLSPMPREVSQTNRRTLWVSIARSTFRVPSDKIRVQKKEPLMAECGDYRVLTAHRFLNRGIIQHIAVHYR